MYIVAAENTFGIPGDFVSFGGGARRSLSGRKRVGIGLGLGFSSLWRDVSWKACGP